MLLELINFCERTGHPLGPAKDTIAKQGAMITAAAESGSARDKAIADLAKGLASTDATAAKLKQTVVEVMEDLAILSEITTGKLCDDYPQVKAEVKRVLSHY